jgi:hypothetical protein
VYAVRFVAIQRDLRSGDDDPLRRRTAARVDAEIAAAARDDQPNVAVDDVVAAAGVNDQFLHRLRRERNRDAQRACRFVQALDVARQLEDAAIVGADPLEDAVAIKEPVSIQPYQSSACVE